VLVLEREVFPRFHVGESLLPRDLPLFSRLGVDPLADGFLCKRGAVFVDEESGQSTLFSFDEGLPGTPPYAYQVDRASFDHWLVRAAERAGARVCMGERVVDVSLGEDMVEVQTESGRHTARFLVDATGQDSFLARRHKSRDPYRDFGKGAVFRRYAGLSAEVAAELYARGDIRILMIEDGWIWVIPLAGNEVSIGVVKKTGRIDAELFERELAGSPMLQHLTRGATCSPSHVISNFSFKNVQPYGRRWACVGDAAAFLDPVFSSGVTLAILGAEQLADLLSPALRVGREAEPELMAPMAAHMQRAYDSFSRLIYRFYNRNIVRNLFFNPSPPARMREGVISVLAADVWREDNPFQDMLLRGRSQQAPDLRAGR
jgi:flavin-dependent dehydrogenase